MRRVVSRRTASSITSSRLTPDRELPMQGEVVVVQIMSLTNEGVYVQLLEYNAVGMVMMNEMSRNSTMNSFNTSARGGSGGARLQALR